jgi:hypothetical protein
MASKIDSVPTSEVLPADIEFHVNAMSDVLFLRGFYVSQGKGQYVVVKAGSPEDHLKLKSTKRGFKSKMEDLLYRLNYDCSGCCKIHIKENSACHAMLKEALLNISLDVYCSAAFLSAFPISESRSLGPITPISVENAAENACIFQELVALDNGAISDQTFHVATAELDVPLLETHMSEQNAVAPESQPASFAISQPTPEGSTFVGVRIAKYFEGHGNFSGKVIGKNGPYWTIEYEDEDSEDVTEEELKDLIRNVNGSQKVETRETGPYVKPSKKQKRDLKTVLWTHPMLPLQSGVAPPCVMGGQCAKAAANHALVLKGLKAKTKRSGTPRAGYKCLTCNVNLCWQDFFVYHGKIGVLICDEQSTMT